MMDEKMLKLTDLEQKIERLTDRAEIENLMSRYQYYYSARMDEEILDEMWARDYPETTIEEGCLGVYENMDGVFPDGGIRGFYKAAMNIGSPSDYPGKMKVYANTTQMIEVAKDGLTAKGLWTAIGTETDAGEYAYGGISEEDSEVSGVMLTMTSQDGKRYQADWVWQKYGVDFVKQDGQWKIWHMHIYDIFRCPFNEDWVSFAQRRGQEYREAVATERCFSPYVKPPGQGSTYFWEYTTTAKTERIPKPPVPYETFDETFRY